MSNRICAIDQSLQKCSITYEDLNKELVNLIIKTGSLDSKNKLDSVQYFDSVEKQVHYICEKIVSFVEQYSIEYVVMEALSFSSIGNQTRNLAQLYGAIVERLVQKGTPFENILTFTPTTVKKYARELLPESDQFVLTGKKKNLVKMDKKMVVKAVTAVVDKKYWGHLKMSGNNGGLDDFCDSWVLLQLAKDKLRGE